MMTCIFTIRISQWLLVNPTDKTHETSYLRAATGCQGGQSP